MGGPISSVRNIKESMVFGNLMNNRQIIKAVKARDIDVTPWDEGVLRSAHYPLTPKLVFTKDASGSESQAHNFVRSGLGYVVPPNGYVIIEICELIKISEGIIGQFIASSNLIEQGFGLTAGRIEHPYGNQGEPVRFGLKNLLDFENVIKPSERIAYIQFFDLRGLNSIPTEFTEREVQLIARRLARARDDGPIYDD